MVLSSYGFVSLSAVVFVSGYWKSDNLIIQHRECCPSTCVDSSGASVLPPFYSGRASIEWCWLFIIPPMVFEVRKVLVRRGKAIHLNVLSVSAIEEVPHPIILTSLPSAYLFCREEYARSLLQVFCHTMTFFSLCSAGIFKKEHTKFPRKCKGVVDLSKSQVS
jgi:hypothetical protein